MTAKPMNPVDFAIITIREDEFEAVLERVGADASWSMLTGPRTGRLYNQCVVRGATPRTVVAVRCLEQGNTEAQRLAHDLLEDIDPQWLFVVGIAGGVATDEFTLGDVVVSSRILDFSVEAVQRDGERTYAVGGGGIDPSVGHVVANLPAMKGALGAWHALGDVTRPSPPTEFYGDQGFQDEVRETIAYHFGDDSAGRSPRVKSGAIISSDRLVKNTDLLKDWMKAARQARAIEMESAGVYRATRDRKPFLAIRGISDIVGARRSDDWTRYACHSAAAFTRALIAAWPLPSAARGPAAATPSTASEAEASHGASGQSVGRSGTSGQSSGSGETGSDRRHLEAELARLLADMFAPRDLYRFLRLEVSRALVDSLPSPDHASRARYAAEVAEKLVDRAMVTRTFLDAWAGQRANRTQEIQALTRWLG